MRAPDERTSQAIELMLAFADRTGLPAATPSTRATPSSQAAPHPKRYLWTDAFAVCAFLGLAERTGDATFGERAERLVDQVHHELGRHRPDDPRRGWLSGLSEEEGEEHPTRGGLRIGKPLPERGPREPLVPNAEWDRDGQYFHYLTKWMHALDAMARATGRAHFHRWARELAAAAHRAFTFGPLGRRRMAWKLSVDLTRALVPSMGHHDPLDGFVTCAELEATAATLDLPPEPDLTAAAADFAEMLDPEGLATSDPLGLGGLLVDAWRLAQIEDRIGVPGEDLVEALLGAAAIGLRRYAAEGELRAPAERRLAFRELGLSIGLAAVLELEAFAETRPAEVGLRASLDEIARYAPMRDEIESFWLAPDHRAAASWTEHQDIDDVLLATSLVPDAFLDLGELRSRRAFGGSLRERGERAERRPRTRGASPPFTRGRPSG
jgi:hypothetical protein